MRTIAEGNCGLETARKSAPFVVGYRPRDEKTYQADMVPRSSLPVIPSGPSVKSVIAARTTVAVLAGAPAHKYMYGECRSGSLFGLYVGFP